MANREDQRWSHHTSGIEVHFWCRSADVLRALIDALVTEEVLTPIEHIDANFAPEPKAEMYDWPGIHFSHVDLGAFLTQHIRLPFLARLSALKPMSLQGFGRLVVESYPSEGRICLRLIGGIGAPNLREFTAREAFKRFVAVVRCHTGSSTWVTVQKGGPPEEVDVDV